MSKNKDEIARAQIDTHQQVCTERYGNIDRRLEAIQKTQAENATQFHARLNELGASTNARFNTISGRWHAVLILALVGAVGGMGTLAIMLFSGKGTH